MCLVHERKHRDKLLIGHTNNSIPYTILRGVMLTLGFWMFYLGLGIGNFIFYPENTRTTSTWSSTAILFLHYKIFFFSHTPFPSFWSLTELQTINSIISIGVSDRKLFRNIQKTKWEDPRNLNPSIWKPLNSMMKSPKSKQIYWVGCHYLTNLKWKGRINATIWSWIANARLLIPLTITMISSGRLIFSMK